MKFQEHNEAHPRSSATWVFLLSSRIAFLFQLRWVGFYNLWPPFLIWWWSAIKKGECFGFGRSWIVHEEGIAMLAKGWFRPYPSCCLSFDLNLLAAKKVKAPISNLKRSFHGSILASLRTLPPLRKQLSSSFFWNNSSTCSSHFWQEFLNFNHTTNPRNKSCSAKHPFRTKKNGPLLVASWKNPTSFPSLSLGCISGITPVNLQWTCEIGRRKYGVSCFNKKWIGEFRFLPIAANSDALPTCFCFIELVGRFQTQRIQPITIRIARGK